MRLLVAMEKDEMQMAEVNAAAAHAASFSRQKMMIDYLAISP